MLNFKSDWKILPIFDHRNTESIRGYIVIEDQGENNYSLGGLNETGKMVNKQNKRKWKFLRNVGEGKLQNIVDLCGQNK